MKSVRENTGSPRKRASSKEAAPPSPAAPAEAPRPSSPAAAVPVAAARSSAPTRIDGGASAGKAPAAREPDEMPADEAGEPSEAWAYEIASSEASSDLTPIVGTNLRRLRMKRGLSLEKLARASSVSRAMLGQIELGQSTPTINVLWKISRALGVPFSALITSRSVARTTVLPAARGKVLTSHDGAFSSRALFPFDEPRTVEFYELRLAPLSTEVADPHPPGTTENLVVTSGALEMTVGTERHLLGTGDAILFEADVSHQYRNPGDTDCVMYLVMTYADKSG